MHELALVKKALTLDSAEQHRALSPIGVITFGKERNIAFIGSSKDSLICGFPTMNDSLRPIQTVNSGRVVHFPQYSNILVAQADLGSITVGTTRSIRQRENTVFAKLAYTLPNGNGEDEYSIDELQLLQLIVGNGSHGGLITFYGKGQPEENALVIEQEIAPNQKEALIVFIHPDESHGTLSSVAGTFGLFQQLNREYQSKIPLDSKVRKALEKIDRLRDEKKINDTSARIEIFKTVLIAFSRLTTLDPSNKQQYESVLNTYLQKILKKNWSSPPKLEPLIDEAVALVIINDNLSTAENVEKEEKPIHEFVNKKYQLIYDQTRERLGDNFGSRDSSNETEQIMYIYLTELLRSLQQAEKLDDLLDLEFMFRELQQSPYGTDHQIPIRYYSNSMTAGEITNPSQYEYSRRPYYQIYSSEVVRTALIVLVDKKSVEFQQRIKTR